MQRLDVLCKMCDRITIVYCEPYSHIDPYCVDCGFCASEDTSTMAYYKSEEEMLVNITNQLEEINARLDALFEDVDEQNTTSLKCEMH